MRILDVSIDRQFIKDLALLILGVGLYVLSVRLFVLPNRLASNGVAGFSVLINFVFGVNPALTFFLVNIPLFIFGWRNLTRRELLLSLPGAACMSLWMLVYEALNISGFQFDHLVLAGLADGILSGIGSGLVVISRGTFGGSLLFSRMLEHSFGFPIDRVLFGIDIFVLSLSLISFLAFPNFVVTLLSCLIFSKVTRFIGRHSYRKQILDLFSSISFQKRNP